MKMVSTMERTYWSSKKVAFLNRSQIEGCVVMEIFLKQEDNERVLSGIFIKAVLRVAPLTQSAE